MRRLTLFALLIILSGCKEPWDGFKSSLADLKSPDPDTRAFAACRLGCHGAEAKVSIPALKNALTDEDPYVRVEAAYALNKIDPGLKSMVIPVLVNAIGGEQDVQDHASKARNIGIKYLGEFGSEASAAVPNLKTRLKDSSHCTRVIAAAALTRIDKATLEIALPILAAGLNLEEGQLTKVEAAKAVLQLGKDADHLMPSVRKLLEDKDTFVSDFVDKAIKANAK